MKTDTPSPIHHKARPETAEDFAVTRNACKLCTPLGATLAFKGIRNSLCLLHGSQGCATYIRRYLISHFREPMDIASSNFTEHTAVFGGRNNLHTALDNLVTQYKPEVVGVATTCLAETIGEDVPAMLRDWLATPGEHPDLISVSTPSYNGTHREGFQSAVRETVRALALGEFVTPAKTENINLLSGMVSPADLRWLHETMNAFGLTHTLLPDYSETLDGGLWAEYQPIPSGGTPASEIKAMGNARASIELGALPHTAGSAGTILEATRGIPLHSLDLPIGISLSDRFFSVLETLSGIATPAPIKAERARLADSYADAHKYLRGIPVLIYGEEDLVVALAAFVAEIGMIPAVCASGGKSGLLQNRLSEVIPRFDRLNIQVKPGIDFIDLEAVAREAGVRIALGGSKGFKLARSMDIPLVRLGFPVHDRFGGQRILHLGYRGAQELFDRIVNTVLQREQEKNPVGYTYF